MPDSLPPWQHAYTGDGAPPAASALLKQCPEDFAVDEILGFAASGDGEHDLLRIEKRGLNTEQVAQALARYAGMKRRDVSYSGQKDRHAVTRQWFSVRRPPRRQLDWSGLSVPGLRVLESAAHQRKLRIGTHRENRFRLVLRALDDADGTLPARFERVATGGVPNYFGEQRFGRGGDNLNLAEALFGGAKMSRHRRSMAISAARSVIFNDVLSARIAAGSWASIQDGEIANLDGSGSVFAVEQATGELRARAEALDIHPTGPLWGRAAPGTGGEVATLEQEVAATRPVLRDGLEETARHDRRPLRVAVREFSWQFDADALVLEFGLPRGAYATSVVRELLRTTTGA